LAASASFWAFALSSANSFSAFSLAMLIASTSCLAFSSANFSAFSLAALASFTSF
jgi:hypothetical protein